MLSASPADFYFVDHSCYLSVPGRQCLVQFWLPAEEKMWNYINYN